MRPNWAFSHFAARLCFAGSLLLPACQWLRAGADARTEELVVDVRTAGARPISPYIFGFGTGMEKDRSEIWTQGPTVYRFGGNASERFNWRTNAYNSSSDWYFQNLTLKAANAIDTFLAENAGHGVASAVTLPLLGWVAKDGQAASFPFSTFPRQQKKEPNGKPFGNGLDTSGNPLKADPATTSVKSDAAFLGEWVAHLRDRFGASPHFYILGNEAMLWGATHRDVHPAPTTYDEYLEKYLAAAIAVRKADPKAVLVGPAEWGWLAVGSSEFDYTGSHAAKGTDKERHGGKGFLEWFLGEVKKKENELKVSLLDVLDYHYYPSNLSLYDDAEAAKTRAARLAATRSLWDPTYVEGSYINQPVALLPLLKKIAAKTKPELKIAVGEYNFHGESDISGALAEAETLRTFIEQDVYMAEYWTHPPAGSAAAAGFRLFRNYDGKGATFGDTYLPNTHVNREDLAVVAAQTVKDRRVTVIVLNKSEDREQRFTLKIDETFPAPKSTTLYAIKAKQPAVITSEALPTSHEARLALPPLSVSLVEFKY